MIPLIIFLIGSDSIQFHVDPITYKSSVTITDTITHTSRQEDIFYLEFNCSIPYNQLSYETVGDTIFSKAVLSFNLYNRETGDSLTDTLRRRFRIPSFSFAAQQQIMFIIQFGLHVIAGPYDYSINIESGDKHGSIQRELTITSEHNLMSDILLASSITNDTTSPDLRKGGLQVVPHPSHLFNDRYANLYLYYEVYNIEPSVTRLKTTYTIRDSAGTLVARIPRRVQKMYSSQAINFGISIVDLESKYYTLQVDVEDEDAGTTVSRQTYFSIKLPAQQQMTFEGMPHYEDIEYFTTKKEYEKYLSFAPEGKKRYLEMFWKEHNYYEIAERFDYADEHFKQGMKSGSMTDRGRVYVKYGRWDEIERSTIEVEESKPYEKWQYYNGIEFIFVDIRNTNEYTLVWTNARNEYSQPTLYKYLPPSIREQIE